MLSISSLVYFILLLREAPYFLYLKLKGIAGLVFLLKEHGFIIQSTRYWSRSVG